MTGKWELVFSDVSPFRASPFFLTIGKLFGTPSSAEDFFRLHRLATSGSEIGRVFQIISDNELSSEVSSSSGSGSSDDYYWYSLLWVDIRCFLRMVVWWCWTDILTRGLITPLLLIPTLHPPRLLSNHPSLSLSLCVSLCVFIM